MPIYKKITKKKMIIYLVIILVMAIMAFIFIYFQQEKEQIYLNEEILKARQSVKAGKILDTSLFNNPKFLSLKDNNYEASEVLDSEIGKPNPFEAPNKLEE